MNDEGLRRRGSLLIRGGRVMDPQSGMDDLADVFIEDGRIESIGPSATPMPETEVVEAEGMIVCPGFVDLHMHLRFPGFPAKETMATGTAAAAAGGFTTVCAMANTNPVVDSVELLHQVFDEASRVARVRVRQIAALTMGLEGKQLTDVAGLVEAGAVGFSDDGKPVLDAEIMREGLQMTARLGKPISVHEEDPRIAAGGVVNEGRVAESLGLPGWPRRAEAQMLARDLQLLESSGGHLHVAHVSCEETVELIRDAKARGMQVTAEVTPHHLCLTEELVAGDKRLGLEAADTRTKVNPPLRTKQDANALLEALREGVIDAVATDHAPHSAADKAGGYDRAAFGISGLETALSLLLGLVRDGRLDLMTLLYRLTAGPARCFGLDAGRLEVASFADVCVFDPDALWTVSAESLQSKGKNTPLLDSRLQGRVIYTIVGGTVVYKASAA